ACGSVAATLGSHILIWLAATGTEPAAAGACRSVMHTCISLAEALLLLVTLIHCRFVEPSQASAASVLHWIRPNPSKVTAVAPAGVGAIAAYGAPSLRQKTPTGFRL